MSLPKDVKRYVNMIKSQSKYDTTEILSGIPREMLEEYPIILQTAIKKNGLALRFFPHNMKTYEICFQAIKTGDCYDGLSITYIPKEMLTSELLYEAIKISKGFVLEYIPEDLLTNDLCTLAYSYTYKVFGNVLESAQTYEMCLDAVKNDGLKLHIVLPKFKTPEVCLQAVKKYGRALEYVPDELKTPELCTEAVKNSPFALEYVPESLRTIEICTDAVVADNRCFEYVPDDIKISHQDICIYAYSRCVPRLKRNFFQSLPQILKNDGNFLLDLLKIDKKLPEYLNNEQKQILHYYKASLLLLPIVKPSTRKYDNISHILNDRDILDLIFTS